MKNSSISLGLTAAVLLVVFGSLANAGDGDTTHAFETNAMRVPTLKTSSGCVIQGVTIHSAVAPAFLGTVVVQGGKITGVSRDGNDNFAEAHHDLLVIDGTGKHLAPGVVDTHSHLAISGGVNEGTLSITADCDISDTINPDDLGIYRALAGGVTTIQCLHGSANAIDGRSEVLKLKWGATAAELVFPDAPQGIKFALGENPKRSNGRGNSTRFPSSRRGIEAVYDRAFTRALAYGEGWKAYEQAVERGEDAMPPRRDLRLETLLGIIEGAVKVHSHSYRADEILMLMRKAEEFGFRVQTLQHVLEGYKIAAEIAEHGAGTSTFSDWWNYKIEAYDAIPQNAALLHEAGVLSTINSDSGELIRHLYHEAAKSVRYAGLNRVDALRLATLNGALQLGLGDRTGSIEVGKDADLVLLDADPLSIYSQVQWTMVDGEIEFERIDAFELYRADVTSDTKLDSESGAAPVLPTENTEGLLAFVGATVHPADGPAIANGTVVVSGSRIVAVGSGIELPAGCKTVDFKGKHIWPGMIALDTPIGLFEIGSVPATSDSSEIGGNQPDLSVTASVHPESAHIGVTRTNGITRTQTAPQGGGPIMGQSSVIDLDGMTWEELVCKDRDMLHINFPRMQNDAKDDKEPERVTEIHDLLEEAREWRRLTDAAKGNGLAPIRDRRLEALAPYALGEKRIALHADSAQTILGAIRFAKNEELDVVLYGVTEGWKVAERIAAEGLSVVVGPVLSVPRSDFDPFDSRYANAAVLVRAGVRVAIMSSDNGNPRNLPFAAGFAANWGLSKDEALRAVTLHAAEVVGLQESLGSLTAGKLADIVVTDGDLFEATTQVLGMWIDGREVSMINRQTRLYDKYRDRLHRVKGK
ncbi:MAG: amidohydrolase family protein [bacterium]|nr:amidohydrolase family protein [bacterium]